MHSFLVFVLTFLSVICLVTAHTITLPAHVKECFFEDLHREDKMTITFQVGDGGNLDVDFWISDPSDRIIESAQKQTTGTYSLTATKDGRYTYCFSNEMSNVSEKTVSFNVHGIVYMPDDGSHTDPLEKEIRELADGLAAIKDEQEYIVIREQRHRDTAESTNDRVKWWSIFQFFVLVGVCFWQVFYLKRFFEVKRVV
ncbi:12525_t:CDS:2 [Funneliformis geosporum]|uniref:15849_t:CDS:1 n=1 Tax=Funneliformis geosporum TaxID=1117311 RepID=A0A9W4WLH7_9GLOM|nr:12525_t:CDS:2 [Funneliformis geosporum]CAI2162818.1 15849_t:CDS:2 [Funneliformis geosporum]